MVTLFITTAVILALFGIGIYFWQKPQIDEAVRVLPPPPNPRGLFAEEPAAETTDTDRRDDLIKEAANGNRSTLDEAHLSGDRDLYDQILAALVRVSDSDPKLLALMSYVSQNELPVRGSLVNAVLASWRTGPDRSGTARALHFAALSDDPDIYRGVVESALELWRAAKLGDISPVELRALFEGEFWVLSSRSRSSGAGFVLKRTLDGARRELEAAAKRQSMNRGLFQP